MVWGLRVNIDPGPGKEDALSLLHSELDSTTDTLGRSCTEIISSNIFLGPDLWCQGGASAGVLLENVEH